MASFRATSAYRLYFAELGTDPTMYLCPQAAPDGSSSGLRKTFRKVKKWSRDWSRAGQPSVTLPEPHYHRTINVKSRPPSHGSAGGLQPFMGQRGLLQTNRLGRCLAALRVLAKSNEQHRDVFVERHIDEYLRNDPFSLAHALERLRRAIHYEELERRKGEDWSVAKNYVRSLLRRMVS